MAEVSGGRVRGRPRLGYLELVSHVALELVSPKPSWLWAATGRPRSKKWEGERTVVGAGIVTSQNGCRCEL